MTEATPQKPLRAAIIPVTPLQQNCSLIWCTATNMGALIDPGGDLPRIRSALDKTGVTLEKILITHGHIDHCGEAGTLAKSMSVPIEGPHEDDRFWISRLEDDGRNYGIGGAVFEPDRWLVHGDTVTVGQCVLDVIH
ncbi:MAG: MBL fold metallo-hydrolase, partial [Sphingopyxis sp.]|nr:MBL fold metallo-hydrolase [Sphingopyxis sp.]